MTNGGQVQPEGTLRKPKSLKQALHDIFVKGEDTSASPSPRPSFQVSAATQDLTPSASKALFPSMARSKPNKRAVRLKQMDLHARPDVPMARHQPHNMMLSSSTPLGHDEDSETFMAGEASPLPVSPMSPKPTKFFGVERPIFDGQDQQVTTFEPAINTAVRLEHMPQLHFESGKAERVPSSSKMLDKGKRALSLLPISNPRSKHAPATASFTPSPLPTSFDQPAMGFHTNSSMPTLARPHTAQPPPKSARKKKHGKLLDTMEPIDEDWQRANCQPLYSDDNMLNPLRPLRPVYCMSKASQSTPSFQGPTVVPNMRPTLPSMPYKLKAEELSNVDEGDTSPERDVQSQPGSSQPIFGKVPNYSRPGLGERSRICHVRGPLQSVEGQLFDHIESRIKTKNDAASLVHAKMTTTQAKRDPERPADNDYDRLRHNMDGNAKWVLDSQSLTEFEKQLQHEVVKLKASSVAMEKIDAEAKALREKHEKDKAEWNRLQEEKLKFKAIAEEKKRLDAEVAEMQAGHELFKTKFEQYKKSVVLEDKPVSTPAKKDDSANKGDDDVDLNSICSSIDTDEEPEIYETKVINLRGAIRVTPGMAKEICILPRRPKPLLAPEPEAVPIQPVVSTYSFRGDDLMAFSREDINAPSTARPMLKHAGSNKRREHVGESHREDKTISEHPSVFPQKDGLYPNKFEPAYEFGNKCPRPAQETEEPVSREHSIQPNQAWIHHGNKTPPHPKPVRRDAEVNCDRQVLPATFPQNCLNPMTPMRARPTATQKCLSPFGPGSHANQSPRSFMNPPYPPVPGPFSPPPYPPVPSAQPAGSSVPHVGSLLSNSAFPDPPNPRIPSATGDGSPVARPGSLFTKPSIAPSTSNPFRPQEIQHKRDEAILKVCAFSGHSFRTLSTANASGKRASGIEGDISPYYEIYTGVIKSPRAPVTCAACNLYAGDFHWKCEKANCGMLLCFDCAGDRRKHSKAVVDMWNSEHFGLARV